MAAAAVTSPRDRDPGAAGSADGAAVPAISVIVPTYQRRERVVRLLSGLASQQLAAAGFEVIVAIDGSTDGTRAAIEALSLPFALRVEEQENRGRSAARNRAVAASRGGILLFLDDDMEPQPALLPAHLAVHADQPDAIVLGPVPIRISATTRPLERYRAGVFASRFDRLSRPGCAPGVTDACMGNLSVGRALFDAAGGFDEEFRGYGLEDFELVRRLVATGGTLRFAPDAVAHQRYDKTLDELARDVEDEGRNSVLFARKHPDMLAELELGRWTSRSRRHRAALTLLVRASLRAPSVRSAIMTATSAVLRAGPPFRSRWLDHVFDYLYWLGVCRAPGGPGGALLAGVPMEQALAAAGFSSAVAPVSGDGSATH